MPSDGGLDATGSDVGGSDDASFLDAVAPGDAPSSDVGVPTDAAPSSDATDALSCLADAALQSQCTMTCASGQICWDYAKHDPLCAGTICSIPCCADSDCIGYAAQHGAALQNNSRCGTDHLCNFVGVLGSFGCQ